MKDFYTIKLDPDTKKHLTLCLFTQVQNGKELKNLVVGGELKCCLLKTTLIADVFQVIVAANKAVTSEKYSKLVTKTIFTEILFNLSTTKNITQSLARFGAQENDTEILVGLIHDSESRESQIENIVKTVKGNVKAVSELEFLCDTDKIYKYYKIDKVEMSVSNLVDSIVSRISAKD